MEDLIKNLNSYKDKEGMSVGELAKKISITEDKLNKILEGNENLEESEITRINEIIKVNKNINRKIVKILDLVFRLCAFIMPLVVIILSIYHFNNLKIMITLLSVGVACLAMTTLPKIEK